MAGERAGEGHGVAFSWGNRCDASSSYRAAWKFSHFFFFFPCHEKCLFLHSECMSACVSALCLALSFWEVCLF